MKRRVVSVVSTVLTVALLAGAFLNRQVLKDQYIIHSTTLQPEAASLLQNIDLTSYGTQVYKASEPLVESSDSFNQSCNSVAKEQSIVLGCYTKQRFYVYNVTDQRLNGVREVTAAHELLHAMYERIPADEKASLNLQLLSAADQVQDQRFKDTLAEYKRTEPDQLPDEIHSILGTEIVVLPQPLEAHYAKYFKNRAVIVNYAKQYEAAFTALDNQIKQYDSQLTDLKQQKTDLEKSLTTQQTAVESAKTRLDTARSSGDIANYNQQVPGYNDLIRSYNQTVTNLKQLVDTYNNIVATRNNVASTQNELVQQLDSTYKPIQ